LKFFQVLAPFAPFLSEEVYRNLTNEESVHLSSWPQADEEAIDAKLEDEMSHARVLASVLNDLRKQAGIKVKIPFKAMNYSGPVKLQEEIYQTHHDQYLQLSMHYIPRLLHPNQEMEEHFLFAKLALRELKILFLLK
jgi:valyl-tRNA synthetase